MSFEDIDPYEVLGVDAKATPLDIKRAYKRLSLKLHPDKLQQRSDEGDSEPFARVQFAYSVLSDAGRRSSYDATGRFDGGDFDWKSYFDSLTDHITLDMIEEDRAKYQGSAEEAADIAQNFAYYEGDFLRLFEVIPHLEFTESAESRVFEIVEKAVEADPATFAGTKKVFDKYKRGRKTKVRQMLRKLAREAKEAEKMEKIEKGDLKAIIQKRQEGRLDALIGSLEAKYAGKQGRKRPSEAEFAAAQQSLKKKRS